MIVKKTLNILDNIYGGKIFLLNNTIIAHHKKTGYLRKICTVKPKEAKDIIKLLKRNRNITFSTSWIEYMKYKVELTLRELNAEHHWKYYERGRELEEENEEYYFISIFLDNHDWEEFVDFKIPKSEIDKEELDSYCVGFMG